MQGLLPTLLCLPKANRVSYRKIEVPSYTGSHGDICKTRMFRTSTLIVIRDILRTISSNNIAVAKKAQIKNLEPQEFLWLLHNCEDHFQLYSLSAVHIYDLYHMHMVSMT